MSTGSVEAEASTATPISPPSPASSNPTSVVPGSGHCAGQREEDFNPSCLSETASPSSASTTTEDESAWLIQRLDLKRREIEAEIEVFKLSKEDEYAEYERCLRERWKRKQQKQTVTGDEVTRDSDVKHDCLTHTGTALHRSGILKEGSRFEEELDELPFAISSPAAFMALNEQNSADPVKTVDDPLEAMPPHAPDCETQSTKKHLNDQSTNQTKNTDKSPPFEEEIQVAGLFTPRFLPLIEGTDAYPRSNPVAISPRPITPPGPHTGSLVEISHNSDGSSSPDAPLASSLKNLAGSGFSSRFSHQLKLKSPKRVSFKLDEEKAIPSRSTPPQTALTFGSDIDLCEDPDAIDVEQVEKLDLRDSTHSPRSSPFGSSIMTGVVIQTPPSVIPLPYRDDLVVPTKITNGVAELAGGGQFLEGGISPRMDDHDWEPVDKGDVHVGFEPVDDDEDLFDMDETLPVSPTDEDGSTNNPDIRTTSPDFDADGFWNAPSDIIATPHGLREAASLPQYSPISSFGSFGVSRNTLPGRRGSLPFSFDNLYKSTVPGSLPANGPSSQLHNGKQMNGGFRRRSVTKYMEETPETSPKQEPHYKGKAIAQGGMRFRSDTFTEEEEEVSPTTFGSSAPITIQTRETKRRLNKAPTVAEEDISPSATTALAATDGNSDIDALDDDGLYGDSPLRRSHIHDSPPGDPLFATDEEYLEGQNLCSSSIHVSSSLGGTVTPPHNPNFIQFATPFPSHPVPAKHTTATSTPLSRSASSTFSSTTASATPRQLQSSPLSPAPPREASLNITSQPNRTQLLNPFISSPKASQYATPLAARVAAEAEENGFEIGSVVGGVDGRTGLDPAVNTGRRSSFALLHGITGARGTNGTGFATLGGSVNGISKKAVGSFATGLAIGIKGAECKTMGELGLGGIAPENMSFSMRLALEEHMENVMSPGVRGR